MDNDNRTMTPEQAKAIVSTGNSAGYDVILETDGEMMVLGSFNTPGVAFEFEYDRRKELEAQGMIFDDNTKLYVNERK